MQTWFASGAATLAILAGMALEAVALTLLFKRAGQGVPPRLLLPNLAAGAALVATTGAALQGAAWPLLALLLLAALAFHLIDLKTRWHK